MKKSEIVARVDVSKMAEDLGLRKSEIKLALTKKPKSIETQSVHEMKSLDRAKELYLQAKSVQRQVFIASKALDLCKSFEDYNKWGQIVGWDTVRNTPSIRGQYAQSIQQFATKRIHDATTFKEIHEIWLNLNEEYLAAEDDEAYQKMKGLTHTTNLLEVFKTFESDGGVSDMLSEEDHHYDALLYACGHATSEEALEVLKWFQKYSWNGEQDTYPIQLLIQTVAQLYKK